MPDSNPTPQDYTAKDGLIDGMDACPHCGHEFLPHDPGATVYDADGTSHEVAVDTDPKDRPFFCVDCFEELDANRRAQENASLEEFDA